jgi:hypothetical protein
MNLPPYNAEATCPKCGHDVVKTSYQPRGCSTPAHCGVRWDGPEHHDRNCQRCHYEWAESVIAPVEQARDGRGDGGGDQ